MSIIISPIMYQGCKRKLINKGLIKCFPKNIRTFYDLFGGSAIVSMNTSAKKYVLNDINIHLNELYNAFKEYDSKTIIKHIKKRIAKYGLPTIRLKRKDLQNTIYKNEDLDNLRKPYKKAFTKLRKRYNRKRNILDFITLMWFSFSQQFRFNSEGDYNMPFGNDIFSETNEEYIKNGCRFFKRECVHIRNKKYNKAINLDKLKKDDFVYLDPPYFNSTAVYNEVRNGCGWTKKDDKKLFRFCESLNDRGIKFGISNCFTIKGRKNKHLIKWCKKHKWNVKHFNVTYTACGKGNSENDEVFITNYSTERKGTFD